MLVKLINMIWPRFNQKINLLAKNLKSWNLNFVVCTPPPPGFNGLKSGIVDLSLPTSSIRKISRFDRVFGMDVACQNSHNFSESLH